MELEGRWRGSKHATAAVVRRHRCTDGASLGGASELQTPDGIARCLWTEAVPLHELGRLKISRANTIEFNNSTQLWELTDRNGKLRFVAQSRSACLRWEQQHLQPLS